MLETVHEMRSSTAARGQHSRNFGTSRWITYCYQRLPPPARRGGNHQQQRGRSSRRGASAPAGLAGWLEAVSNLHARSTAGVTDPTRNGSLSASSPIPELPNSTCVVVAQCPAQHRCRCTGSGESVPEARVAVGPGSAHLHDAPRPAAPRPCTGDADDIGGQRTGQDAGQHRADRVAARPRPSPGKQDRMAQTVRRLAIGFASTGEHTQQVATRQGEEKVIGLPLAGGLADDLAPRSSTCGHPAFA